MYVYCYSYSRQNLLSTKSNEGIQNQSATGGGYSVERTTNNITDRCQSYTFPSFSTQKRNPNQQESSNSSADNTPKRKTALKTSRHSVNTENIVNVSADVVNVNDVHRKSHDNNDLMEEISVPIGFEPFADAFADHLDTAVVVNNNSNRTADNTHNCKNCSAPSLRNRNEWHNNTNSETSRQQSNKSKLFDDLRENVYKEVASLISANQGRPHFLIQLFRDLQMVSSDPMRRKTLQSIQSLISHSLSGNGAGILQQVRFLYHLQFENNFKRCFSLFL